MATSRTHDPSEHVPTLPAWLRAQARSRGEAVALRRKVRGLWRPRTWREVEREVIRLAAGLAARGFRPGDSIAVVSEPRPEAVLVSLAAQWLGGSALPVDPALPVAKLDKTEGVTPRFAFIEKEAHGSTLRQLLADTSSPQLSILGDARGFVARADAQVVAYDHLAEGEPEPDAPELIAAPDRAAFLFPRPATHAQIVVAARAVARTERLHSEHDALVSRSLATLAHVSCVIGPWLVAGFRLNFPETLSTRDHDRHELAPTFVVGTAETYARLRARIVENLPPEETLQRRLVEWALAADHGLLRKIAGQWLVARPLRSVTGLSRVEVSLAVGEPPEPAVLEFFSRLGLEVKTWPRPSAGQPSAEGPRVSRVRDRSSLAEPLSAVPAPIRERAS